jgi:hypothetical protein
MNEFRFELFAGNGAARTSVICTPHGDMRSVPVQIPC